MGDQDDRLSLVTEHTQDAKQMIGLTRRQHAGGLVQNQDIRAAEQRLQNFHPLLKPDRKRTDHGIRIDLKRVFAFQSLQLLPRPRQAAAQRPATLRAQDDVLQHRKRIHQHEMLMHHADSRPNRIIGGSDRHGLSADPDLAALGLVEAIEDAHQGRFSGTVLADNPMDRSARNR